MKQTKQLQYIWITLFTDVWEKFAFTWSLNIFNQSAHLAEERWRRGQNIYNFRGGSKLIWRRRSRAEICPGMSERLCPLISRNYP